MRGLVPGGELGDRNSVYLTPVSPWNQGFEDASRKGVEVFVRVDPEVLMRTVATGSVMQTASGTVIVRDAIVPKAIVCVVTKRAGGYANLWHRDVADQSPTTSGPRTMRCRPTWQMEGRGWKRKETDGRDSVPARHARTTPSDALWMIAECMTCQSEIVSGTVECFVCGATQFYNATRAENVAYAEAPKKAAEDEEKAAVTELGSTEREAIKQLVEQRKDARIQQYGISGVRSVEKRLRDKVAQLHRHRWRWMGTGAAEDQYRRECARKGGTVISWMEDRTESWTPNDDKEYSINLVQVSPAEVVYYFLSVLMDADGKQPEGKPFKASSAKLVSDTLVQVFVEVDFEEVSTRVMSNVDETDNWIWKMYRAKYNSAWKNPQVTPVADIQPYWEAVRTALVTTQEDFSLNQAIIMRDTGRTQSTWRKGEDPPTGRGKGRGSASAGSSSRGAGRWLDDTAEVRARPSRAASSWER